MKKIKILILFLIIIVLTGCNSHYDLTINKDLTVNEEASLAPDYGFLYDIKVTSKEYFEEVYNSEKKELLDSNGYTHRISDDNNSILISKNYRSLKEYANKTIAISQFFENIDVIESNGIITFKTGKFKEQDVENLDAFEIDKLKINIKSDYKFISSNSDAYSESTNTYTWLISSGYTDMSIEFSIDTSDKYSTKRESDLRKSIIYIIIFLICLWLGSAILSIYRKDKPEYY